MKTLLCCAVALMLAGCASGSKSSAAPAGGSTAPSSSTTATAGGTPSSTGGATTTAGGGSGASPKPTGAFCADVRNGAVSAAVGDAVNPSASNSSLDELKKIDGEAPSEIKSAVDTLLQVLGKIRDAGSDSKKQAELAAGGGQLQSAAASIGTYITAHCG